MERNTPNFRLSMIPKDENALFFENEILLADNIGSRRSFKQEMMALPSPLLRLDFVMSLFCMRGSLDIVLNQKAMTLKANQVLLITPNDIAELISEELDMEVFLVGFSNADYLMKLFKPDSPDLGFFLLFNRIIDVSEEEMQEYHLFYSLMKRKLSSEDFIPKKEFMSKGLALMDVIMGNTLRQARKKSQSTSNPRSLQLFADFISLVKEHFREEHSIQFYADRLCLTPKYLSQLVHEVSGRFAGDWIRDCLLDEAKSLLKESRHTISEVSDLLGFPSSSYFNRFFKRETGMTPKNFQKMQRQPL